MPLIFALACSHRVLRHCTQLLSATTSDNSEHPGTNDVLCVNGVSSVTSHYRLGVSMHEWPVGGPIAVQCHSQALSTGRILTGRGNCTVCVARRIARGCVVVAWQLCSVACLLLSCFTCVHKYASQNTRLRISVNIRMRKFPSVNAYTSFRHYTHKRISGNKRIREFPSLYAYTSFRQYTHKRISGNRRIREFPLVRQIQYVFGAIIIIPRSAVWRSVTGVDVMTITRGGSC